jgi:hypothetical protein
MSTKYSRQRKETEELIAGIRRQVIGLEQRAAEDDPWVMAEMVNLSDELRFASVRVVAALRRAGYTWSAIGFELGLTRQAAFERYGKTIKHERESQ